MRIIVKDIQSGVPTENGRIYTAYVLRDMVKEFNHSDKRLYIFRSTLQSWYVSPSDPGTGRDYQWYQRELSYNTAIGTVQGVRFDGKNIFLDLHFIKEPLDREQFVPIFEGTLTGQVVNADLKLVGVRAVMPVEDENWENEKPPTLF